MPPSGGMDRLKVVVVEAEAQRSARSCRRSRLLQRRWRLALLGWERLPMVEGEEQLVTWPVLEGGEARMLVGEVEGQVAKTARLTMEGEEPGRVVMEGQIRVQMVFVRQEGEAVSSLLEVVQAAKMRPTQDEVRLFS